MDFREYKELEKLFTNAKPYLRFRRGDIVFLKTDFARKNPMCIHEIIDPFGAELGDYNVSFFDSQKCLKFENLFDVALIPSDVLEAEK